jgi:ribosomal protein S18 acetylase RimI-like enzyme
VCSGDHPLKAVLEDAAAGRFPPVDGAFDVLPPDDSGLRAVVAFTGHAYVLADFDPDELAQLGADGYGGASHPEVLLRLAGPAGHVGSVDVVLVAEAGAGPTLPPRTDLVEHPRVRRAAAHRAGVEVYGDEVGLVVLGTGLAGRRELSVELLDPAAAGQGHGRRLIRAGLARLAAGERCWAQVAPGNAASLRAFLACGFVPVGSEVLITPGPTHPTPFLHLESAP